jgi:hypothetical protein
VPNDPDPTIPPGSDRPQSADSSPASGKGSPTSEGFIADAGPEFEPEAAAPINAGVPRQPPPPGPEATAPIVWEEDTVEALLRLKGRGLHAAAGVGEADWLYTELDLAAIAPPLTRICNRYEPIAKLAQHSDPLLLAFAFGGYGLRSVEERRRALAEFPEEDEDVPEAAPPSPDTAVPLAPPPAPPAPPRQATNFPTGPAGAPPMQPTEERPPAPPPRPVEAQIDPQAVDWERRT